MKIIIKLFTRKKQIVIITMIVFEGTNWRNKYIFNCFDKQLLIYE
jgi:hypothetical protein